MSDLPTFRPVAGRRYPPAATWCPVCRADQPQSWRGGCVDCEAVAEATGRPQSRRRDVPAAADRRPPAPAVPFDPAALDGLSETQRTYARMHFVLRLSVAAIALKLNRSEGAVSKGLGRARLAMAAAGKSGDGNSGFAGGESVTPPPSTSARRPVPRDPRPKLATVS